MAKKAGGNTSTRGDSYDSVKWGSNKSPSAQAITGSALISGQSADMEYGLSFAGETPEGPSDKGVYKWETHDCGKAPGPHRSRPRSGNPNAGMGKF